MVSDCFCHCVCLTAGVREAVQASGPLDPTGRVQVAEETLSQSAPDLQRLLQTARHHRYGLAASTCAASVAVIDSAVKQLDLHCYSPADQYCSYWEIISVIISLKVLCVISCIWQNLNIFV